MEERLDSNCCTCGYEGGVDQNGGQGVLPPGKYLEPHPLGLRETPVLKKGRVPFLMKKLQMSSLI